MSEKPGALNKLSAPGAGRAATPNNDRDDALQSMRSIYTIMRRRSTVLRRDTGMGSASLWALSEIVSRPGARIGDLAGRLRVHPSTASNLCAQLFRDGLATKRSASEDARVTCLYPSRKGKLLVSRIRRPRAGSLVQALSRMTTEECRALVVALEPLQRELGGSSPDE